MRRRQAVHTSFTGEAVFCLLLPSLALLGCTAREEPGVVTRGDYAATEATSTCVPFSPSSFALDCPAPPDTFDTGSLTGTDMGSAWDRWAWSSFAAYNWPALTSTDGGTYPTGYVRGVPDTSKSFLTAQGDDVTVWETFKEKRELFNDLATPDAWQQLTFDPTYAPDTHGGDVAMCSDADPALVARAGKRLRVIAQLSKQAPSIDGDSSVDETAEVASPAQESTDDLCAGYTSTTDPTLEYCQTMMFFPPKGGGNGDEYKANEDNYRTAVGPRVFKGSPGAENFVYYEVKLNYDYYAYVAAPITVDGKPTSLNDYDSAVTQAKAAKIHLPFRTSAQAMSGSQNTASVVGYTASEVATCYGNFPTGCATATATNLPPIGSVQVKSAWIPADLVDGSDLSDYHTTYAVYYRDDDSQSSGLCYDVQQFALIGLHIIQRVHGGGPSAAKDEPIGGTFIFATWEHESIADGAGYSYVNYVADQAKEQTDPNPYPNTAAGLQVARLQTYPLASTAAVNTAVQAQLGNSVWQNYRLIGTQFQAISSESDSTALGQPYYLANLVIETNRGLQQFQGRPPAVQVIDNYSKQIPPVPGVTPHFAPMANNMAFGSNGATGFDMGGCMGCHGVAQSQGFAFSFVLQDGSFGTKPDTAGTIAIPPKAPQTPSGS